MQYLLTNVSHSATFLNMAAEANEGRNQAVRVSAVSQSNGGESGMEQIKTDDAGQGTFPMTVDETAAFLRVNRSTIYRLVKRQRLPAAKVGGLWCFDAQQLAAWIETHSTVGR
jgi:excisionase family DNA binding protein